MKLSFNFSLAKIKKNYDQGNYVSFLNILYLKHKEESHSVFVKIILWGKKINKLCHFIFLLYYFYI